jgi:ribosomal protein L11 methyltransferase
MQRLRDAGVAAPTWIDVGTGSGILAIAAAQMWPRSRGVAIDNDPVAVRTAAENCALNGVGARVVCAETPVAEVDGAWPLVLANIQAHVLYGMRDALIARLAPGGQLVLSGLLTTQAEAVARDFAAAAPALGVALEVAAVRRSADDPQWSSVRLARPAAGRTPAP